MPKYREHDKDIIRVLTREIRSLERRVKHLENSKHVTLPIYDVSAGEVPNPTPQGLIFIAANSTLRFYKDGTIFDAGP